MYFMQDIEQNFGQIDFLPHIGAYIMDNGWMVPNPDDTTVPPNIHTEFDPLYQKLAAYAQEHPDKVTVRYPHVPTLDEVKSNAIQRIDSETSAAILAGFDYAVDTGTGTPETLHFSYDNFDQQNFADTANMALLNLTMPSSLDGELTVPTSVTWNAYRNYIAETGGELVRLVLNTFSFLDLYTNGALAHKALKMEIGGQKKEKVESATSIEEVQNIFNS